MTEPRPLEAADAAVWRWFIASWVLGALVFLLHPLGRDGGGGRVSPDVAPIVLGILVCSVPYAILAAIGYAASLVVVARRAQQARRNQMGTVPI